MPRMPSFNGQVSCHERWAPTFSCKARGGIFLGLLPLKRPSLSTAIASLSIESLATYGPGKSARLAAARPRPFGPLQERERL